MDIQLDANIWKGDTIEVELNSCNCKNIYLEDDNKKGTLVNKIWKTWTVLKIGTYFEILRNENII